MKVTITKIFREQKISAANKTYASTRIKTQEYGDKWIGGFGNKTNNYWKEGDVVDIEIKQNGEYLNFEMPKPLTPDEIEQLRQLLKKFSENKPDETTSNLPF